MKPAAESAFFRSAWMLIKDSAAQWSDDKASRLAAALSYYTIFSLAPLLVLAISVAGLVFGREAASDRLFHQIRDLVGDQGALAIQTMVENVNRSGGGVIATVVGLATLFLGASGAFGQLQDALNTIWQVKPKPGQGIAGFLRTRFLSFSMVLVIGFMLLVTLVISALLAGLGHYLGSILPVPGFALQALNFLISFGVTALLFTLIYKVLPDVTVRWKDVWIGGAVTALLFSLGRFLIGLYLGRGSVSSAYGAAGSLVIILLWIYYSSQILFFGAEFTKVYANAFGSHIKPSPHAEAVSPDTRAQEGLEPATVSPHSAAPASIHAPPAPAEMRARPGSVEEMEAEIARTRARMDENLSRLGRKVRPSPFVRNTLAVLKTPMLALVTGSIGYLAYKRLRARPAAPDPRSGGMIARIRSWKRILG